MPSGIAQTSPVKRNFARYSKNPADIAENGVLPQIFDFFRGKMHIFQEIECLFEACCHQVIAMRWKMADKQLEGGASIEAGLQISRSHGQLVEIGEKARVFDIFVFEFAEGGTATRAPDWRLLARAMRRWQRPRRWRR